MSAGVISVLLLGVLAVAGGMLYVRWKVDHFTHVQLPQQTLPEMNGAQNVLLVGSDTRVGVGGGFGHASTISGQRSDTVILAHLPKGSAKPTLVSFPRDSYVEIPAYRDSSGVSHPAHMDKLNTAYSLGGYQLLIRTISNLTGLRIDHYVEVNFAGFEKIVNAIGGVTLCARTSRNDPANGPQGGSNDFMTAGVHPNVSGAVALAFVRDRHSFANEDISRIQDQQYFLAQVVRKVDSVGTLFHPSRVFGLLDAAQSSIRVDSGLHYDQIKSLVERLRHLDPGHMRFVTLPFSTSNGTATINGVPASVVMPDKAKDQQLFDRLRTDQWPHSSQQHHSAVHGVSGRSLTCGA